MTRIKLKNTPKQVELIQAMADKDSTKAMQAREAFAEFIGPVIQQVLKMQALSPLIYEDWEYSGDNDPEIELDQFYNTGVGHVTVWQQSIAGGLGSNLLTGLTTLKVQTYELDSAVSLLVRNVQRGVLPYVSNALNRMAQEILVYQEYNAFYILLKALGEASTNGTKHVIAATTANVLQLDDFNRLLTRSKRLNVAFNGGTPDRMYSRGATDMIMSPEMMEQIRAFAYQPMNTRAVPNTDDSTALGLPDSVRTQIYNSGGESSIYGINLHEALEMGINQSYNNIFGAVAVGINGPGGAAFATGTDELVLAWDANRKVALRPVNTDLAGNSVGVFVDDQFSRRSGKIGWFTKIVEGRLILDSRFVTGIAV